MREPGPLIGDLPASLAAPLVAAARRLALQRTADAAAWSVVAAAAALTTALAARHLSGPGAAEPLSPGWPLAAAAAVLLAGLAATLLHARRSRPTLAEVARLADRRYGLDEELATALEAARGAEDGRAPSPVALALLRSATRHAARIRPEEVVPTRLPRAVRFLPLALVPCLALAFVPTRAPAPADAFRSASRAILGADPANPAAGVLAAAGFFGNAAAELDDAYLAAVASAMRALGERVAAGEVDRAEAESELARLLEHAERASSAAESALATSAADGAPNAGEVAPGESPPGEELAAAGSPAPGTAPEAPPVPGQGRMPSGNPSARPPDPGKAPAEDTPQRRLGVDAAVAEVIAAREGPKAEQQAGDGGDADAAYGEAEPRPGNAEAGVMVEDAPLAALQTEPAPGQPGTPAATPDTPAGAAAQPREEEYGEIDLYAEYYADLLEYMVDLNHIPLSMRTAAGGTEAAVELPPEARRGAATIRDAAAAAVAWRRSDEEPYDPGDIALRYRAIASRYFRSLTELPEPGPAE